MRYRHRILNDLSYEEGLFFFPSTQDVSCKERGLGKNKNKTLKNLPHDELCNMPGCP